MNEKALVFSWMMVENSFLPCGSFYMGIDFRSQDAFVTEHFLDNPEVCSVFYKMGRE